MDKGFIMNTVQPIFLPYEMSLFPKSIFLVKKKLQMLSIDYRLWSIADLTVLSCLQGGAHHTTHSPTSHRSVCDSLALFLMNSPPAPCLQRQSGVTACDLLHKHAVQACVPAEHWLPAFQVLQCFYNKASTCWLEGNPADHRDRFNWEVKMFLPW